MPETGWSRGPDDSMLRIGLREGRLVGDRGQQGEGRRPGRAVDLRSLPTGESMAVPGFGSIRNRIQKAFLKNLLKRQGSALFGRALPFGIGAVVGGAGNLMMGRAVVSNAKEAFGPMPDTIPGELTAAAAAQDTPTLEGKTLGSQR